MHVKRVFRLFWQLLSQIFPPLPQSSRRGGGTGTGAPPLLNPSLPPVLSLDAVLLGKPASFNGIPLETLVVTTILLGTAWSCLITRFEQKLHRQVGRKLYEIFIPCA